MKKEMEDEEHKKEQERRKEIEDQEEESQSLLAIAKKEEITGHTMRREDAIEFPVKKNNKKTVCPQLYL